MDPPMVPGGLRKSILKGTGPPQPPPMKEANLSAVEETEDQLGDLPSGSSRPAIKLPEPVSWNRYWDKREQISVPSRNATFNVYEAGRSGAALYCIHGGGYTGLTWSLVAAIMKEKYRIVAPDLRGHGLTKTNDDLDFSKEAMSEDVIDLWQEMYGSKEEDTPVLLVGHSMGGAIATWAAASNKIKNLAGLVVIDLVEGTALAALPHMKGILASRPSTFASPGDAIKWCLRTGMCRSKESAAVSMPSMVKPVAEDAPEGRCQWVTPLDKSEPFWKEWYTGLSEQYLKLTCPKMLILAGSDRLDKDLMIGQMQGKFQLVLLPQAGHAIHEDEAAKSADYLMQFLKRFRIGEPPLVIGGPRPPGIRPVLPIATGPPA